MARTVVATVFTVFFVIIVTFSTESAVADGPEDLLAQPASGVTGAFAPDLADQEPFAGDVVDAVDVVAREGEALVERALASANDLSDDSVSTSSDVVDEAGALEHATAAMTEAADDLAAAAADASGDVVAPVGAEAAPATQDVAGAVAPAAPTVRDTIAPAAVDGSQVIDEAASVAAPVTAAARDAVASTQPAVAPVISVAAPVTNAVGGAAAPLVEDTARVAKPVAEAVASVVAPAADVIRDTGAPVNEPVVQVVAPVVAPPTEGATGAGAPAVQIVVDPGAVVARPVVEAVAPMFAQATGTAPSTQSDAGGPSVELVASPAIEGLSAPVAVLGAPSDARVSPPEAATAVGWVIGATADAPTGSASAPTIETPTPYAVLAPGICDAIAVSCERVPGPGFGGGELAGVDWGRVWAGTPDGSPSGIGLPGLAADRRVLTTGTLDATGSTASPERRADGTVVQDVCTAVGDFTKTLTAEVLSVARDILELAPIMAPDPGQMDFSDADAAWRSVARIVVGLTFSAFLLFAFWRLARVPRPLGW